MHYYLHHANDVAQQKVDPYLCVKEKAKNIEPWLQKITFGYRRALPEDVEEFATQQPGSQPPPPMLRMLQD